MRILLLTPPTKMMLTLSTIVNPLGTLYMASAIRQHGRHDVNVLDCLAERMTLKELITKLRRDTPDVVGISFTTDSRFHAFGTARAIREAFPGIFIVGGGPHATVAAQDTLEHVPAFDALVRGEGEVTVVDLLDTLEAKGELSSIPGLSFRRGDEIVHNPDRELVRDLDDLPFPAWDMVDLGKYSYWINNDEGGKAGEFTANIISSRGCPAQCAFCSNALLWGRRTRMRSAKSFVDEIEMLHRDYQVSNFRITDDSFNINRRRVIEICEEILVRGLDIRWDCSIRVDAVSLEMLQLMKRAGCIQVFFGVESVHEKTLDGLIGKNITLEQVNQTAEWCRQTGIGYYGGFIISFPDETVEDMWRTVEFSKAFQGKSTVNILRIYPGTRIETMAKERGVLPPDFSWANEMFTLSNSLPALSGPVPLYIESIPWPELQKVLFQWAQDNHFSLWRPLFLAIKGIRRPSDVFRLFQFGVTYLRHLCKI